MAPKPCAPAHPCSPAPVRPRASSLSSLSTESVPRDGGCACANLYMASAAPLAVCVCVCATRCDPTASCSPDLPRIRAWLHLRGIDSSHSSHSSTAHSFRSRIQTRARAHPVTGRDRAIYSDSIPSLISPSRGLAMVPVRTASGAANGTHACRVCVPASQHVGVRNPAAGVAHAKRADTNSVCDNINLRVASRGTPGGPGGLAIITLCSYLYLYLRLGSEACRQA
ncbi:hypothetical protein C2E23DRAFT_566559 [Lenzites betulinus]|nr:hypothetical protein C2E23DRAFT_566559 [Lenzites betulinus]